MIIKRLRLKNKWTQDQLSVMSGLSLRTVQRIEQGHKASLESLKSLAAVFDVDIETLEQDNMAIDKSSSEWKQNPLWLRILFWGSNITWLNSRKEALIFEVFMLALTTLTLVIALLKPDTDQKLFGVCISMMCLFSTYIWAVLVRLSDRYSIWQTGT